MRNSGHTGAAVTLSGRTPDDAEWQALVQRAPFAGFYAVVTTGVACRAGCPARTPLRRNLRMFATLEAAEAAGFRRCKRCRPGSV